MHLLVCAVEQQNSEIGFSRNRQEQQNNTEHSFKINDLVMFCIVLFFYLPNIVDKMTQCQFVAWRERGNSLRGYRVGMTDP